MNPHLSKDTTTPDTASTTKHAGWEAARAGKNAWIIDTVDPEVNEFEYTCQSIKQMRWARKCYCKALKQGTTL